MTTTLSPRRLAVAFAALAIAALASPVDAQPTRQGPDVGARLARLTEGLTLTPDQQTRLDALATRTVPEPGAAWALATDLKAILTPAQIAQLQQARTARRAEGARSADRTGSGERRGRAGSRADGGRRGGRRGERVERTPRDGARPDAARMTAEQRTALREIADAFRPRQEALVAQFRSGALTAAQFTAQREALRSEREARMEAALTPEQRAARTEHEARRDAARAAREQALGLTPSQTEALQALKLERLRTRPARPERPAQGERPTPEQREALRAARRTQAEATREQVAAILTPDQQALVTLHHALAGEHGRGGSRGGQRPGRPQ